MSEALSHSPDETESIAAEWSATLQPGQAVLLSGDLGAGKTCFVRGLVRGWKGNPGDVSSPSFSLVNEYATSRGTIHHWDLYRLPENTDWSVLDLDDHLHNSRALTVIEWPERRADLDGLRVQIDEVAPDRRKIMFQGGRASRPQ